MGKDTCSAAHTTARDCRYIVSTYSIRQWYLWKVFSGNQKLVGSCHFIDTSCINLEFSLGTLWGSKLWVWGKMQLLLSYDRTLCGGKDIYQSDTAQVPKYFLCWKWLFKTHPTDCCFVKYFSGMTKTGEADIITEIKHDLRRIEIYILFLRISLKRSDIRKPYNISLICL